MDVETGDDAGANAGRAITSLPGPRLTAVYGGGGPLGVAYGLGVVDALRDAGLSLTRIPMLGTSAGAWVASCIATGTTFADLCELPPMRVPNLSPGLLRRMALEAFGEAGSPLVRATAVRVPSGRRTILSGGDHPLADIVAASSAVPWMFAPTKLGRRLYADGGVRSLVHADRAGAAQHLLVVAPMAGHMFGPAGHTMELMLRKEIRRWQQVTGGHAHLIRPNRRIAGLVRHPLDLFDQARARAAYTLAYEQASRLYAEAGVARLHELGESA